MHDLDEGDFFRQNRLSNLSFNKFIVSNNINSSITYNHDTVMIKSFRCRSIDLFFSHLIIYKIGFQLI